MIEPQRGSYVSRIRLADVKQWMLMRRLLEVEVAEKCASELPDARDRSIEPKSRLSARRPRQRRSCGLSRARYALPSPDDQRARPLRAWAKRSTPSCMHLDRVRRTLLPAPGRMEGTFAEHRAIYQAIAERRPDGAALSMRAHLGSVLRELENFVPRHPGFLRGWGAIIVLAGAAPSLPVQHRPSVARTPAPESPSVDGCLTGRPMVGAGRAGFAPNGIRTKIVGR